MANSRDRFATAASALQSSEHGQLLDVIDHLRALGIDRTVPLPQLVVCGDQSSGKSSVLEAVAGVRFPTKDTLCTRFATELILRRSVAPSVDIKIRPSHDRSPDEQAKLLAFESPSGDLNEFPQLVEAAKEAIGIDEHTKRFSEDVLRVELSGPDRPHLTLVDLPGVFHSGTKDQSLDEAKLVKSLVQRYMRNKRSIILAVVSAKNDFANQIVTQMARTFDPKGLRTMGIVTKPDTLIPGSDSEVAFLRLLKNEDVAFRLGWHVLRNRDFNTKDYTTEDRDKEEKIFFSTGAWTSLPADTVGIDPLKPRLSSILRRQIISVLPSMIEDVERGIKDCNARLERLGDTRGTLQEQRQYLIRVSQRFSALIKAAMDGVYGDEFFGDPMTLEGESKRLRAVIQDFLLRFAEDMRRNGHHWTIIADDTDAIREKEIDHSEYLEHVRDLMRRTRGRELPGTFNPLIIGDLFYEQAKPWKALIDQRCKAILDIIKRTIRSTVESSTDSATAEGLLQTILYPALENRKAQFEAKIFEILEPHRRGHAITYNHYFTDTVQKARNEHQRQEQERRLRTFLGVGPTQAYTHNGQLINISQLVGSLAVSNQEDMDLYACSEATYCMKAYYKVAMKVLVDNFSVLAVERCLLSDLADILSPNTIIKISDAEVSALAAESETSIQERWRAMQDMETLQEGLTVLNRFSPLGGAGTADHNEDDEEGTMTPLDNNAEVSINGDEDRETRYENTIISAEAREMRFPEIREEVRPELVENAVIPQDQPSLVSPFEQEVVPLEMETDGWGGLSTSTGGGGKKKKKGRTIRSYDET